MQGGKNADAGIFTFSSFACGKIHFSRNRKPNCHTVGQGLAPAERSLWNAENGGSKPPPYNVFLPTVPPSILFRPLQGSRPTLEFRKQNQ